MVLFLQLRLCLNLCFSCLASQGLGYRLGLGPPFQVIQTHWQVYLHWLQSHKVCELTKEGEALGLPLPLSGRIWPNPFSRAISTFQAQCHFFKIYINHVWWSLLDLNPIISGSHVGAPDKFALNIESSSCHTGPARVLRCVQREIDSLGQDANSLKCDLGLLNCLFLWLETELTNQRRNARLTSSNHVIFKETPNSHP